MYTLKSFIADLYFNNFIVNLIESNVFKIIVLFFILYKWNNSLYNSSYSSTYQKLVLEIKYQYCQGVKIPDAFCFLDTQHNFCKYNPIRPEHSLLHYIYKILINYVLLFKKYLFWINYLRAHTEFSRFRFRAWTFILQIKLTL